MFTGQEHDEQTGLIYFGARFYDPDTARFINQDSYLGKQSTPPSLHRYLYAYSNPTYYIDPNGNIGVPGFTPPKTIDEANQQLEARAGAGRAFGAFADDLAFNLPSTAMESDSLGDFAGKVAQQAQDYALETAKENAAERFATGACTALRPCRAIGKRLKAAGEVVAEQYGKAKDKINKKRTKENDAKLNNPTTSKNKTESAANRGGCPCCFASGTPVLTIDGLRPIESIELGDLVASKDELTGEITWKPVSHLFVNDDDRITYVLVLTNEAGVIETLEVTDNHPFNVEGVGWVESADLEAGMQVPTYEGGYLTVVSIAPLDRSPVTYNFEVADFHTYFVGEQGAWVHNQCDCVATQKSIDRNKKKVAKQEAEKGKPSKAQRKADHERRKSINNAEHPTYRKHTSGKTNEQRKQSSSNGGDGQYNTDVDARAIEKKTLKDGVPAREGNTEHYYKKHDEAVGYSNGKETKYSRAERTGTGDIHGHPRSASDIPSDVLKKLNGD